MKQDFLQPSTNPIDDIARIAYMGQPLEMRMYKEGYEDYFAGMPILQDDSKYLHERVQLTKSTVKLLANELRDDPWTASLQPLPGRFNRTILGLEAPAVLQDGTLKEGTELVLARWGDGHTSPVHGHAAGYLHEELLFGQMRVNTYRIIDAVNRIARPLRTDIYSEPGTIASMYTAKNNTERSALVHNFTSVGYSASLHYLPEHTRDGRDNRFTVDYFEDEFALDWGAFTQINAQQGLWELKVGDVALVRSGNVPEYGDHYIVVTGRPVLKPNGLRPMDVAIHAPHAGYVFEGFKDILGLTLLKLNDGLKQSFLDFHGIKIVGNNVIFPNG